ncbi:MAG: DNA mismatch repair protein MutS, partial [Christensenellales bacterium]
MALTPMMQQYLLMKEEHKGCLLFYRLGDFYEMFFEDALLVSRELGLTLTGRDCGLEERAPMCGVPHHAAEGYIAKLIAKGYQVAICEQTSDPALSKGLVDRDVVRVITPGTVIESSMLDETRDNYILCLYLNEEHIGLSYCDVSTGFFQAGEISAQNDILSEELARIQPAEVIADESFFLAAEKFPALFQAKDLLLHPFGGDAFQSAAARKRLLKQFQGDSLQALGMEGQPHAVCAAGALLAYLEQTQKVALNHINRLSLFGRSHYMILDSASRRNLELTQPLRGEGKKGTLLHVLDKTMTAMGGRMLRSFIDQPLQDPCRINQRLDSVEELKNAPLLTDEVRDILNEAYDISRLCSRISYGTLNARDCIALKNTLGVLPKVTDVLRGASASLLQDIRSLDPMTDLFDLLEAAIAPEPPAGVSDGNIIRDGYDDRVDKLRHMSSSGRKLLFEMEAAEREATGIKNLKIGYNKVFGYYIEITKSYLSQVPYRYTRKQTLVNAERFITAELKELEESILGAHDKCIQLEYDLFCGIRNQLNANISRLQQAAVQLSLLDVLQSFAFVAVRQDYSRPSLNTSGHIHIRDGRHPVVEKSQPLFVANDTDLDKQDNRLLIITGPNMAGKSTYMRQVALLTLLAH